MAVLDKNAMRFDAINQSHIIAERTRERERHGFLGNMTEQCKKQWETKNYYTEENDGTEY